MPGAILIYDAEHLIFWEFQHLQVLGQVVFL